MLELDAAGDLDAAVDVFRRDRSQLTSLDCGQTNRRGRLTLDFRQPRNAELLIRVAAAAELRARRVHACGSWPPTPRSARPGARCAPRARPGSLDRIANPDDAYGISMSAGRTYRVHLVSRGRCVNAALYPPGTSSFEGGDAVRSFDCDDYFLFTPGPGEGGRYSIQVQAPRSRRGALPYHLQVARAGEDDTAPGAELANDDRVRGVAARRRGGRRRPLPLRRAAPEHPRPAAAGGASSPFNLQLVGAERAADRLRVRLHRGPADPAAAEAGALLRRGAGAQRGERALHAVAPDAHDHTHAACSSTASATRAVRPGAHGHDRRARGAGRVAAP